MSPDNYSLLIALPLYLHSAFFLGLVFPAWLAAGQIHDAAFFGKLDTIQTLIDNGADIDERDSFDRTELHRAAGKDSPKVAEFLISKGSNLDAKDKLGWTPIFVSANAGYAITAAALLRHGADPDARDDAGKTPLFQAAFVGYYDGVKTTGRVRCGRSSPIEFAKGKSPVHYHQIWAGNDRETPHRSRRRPSRKGQSRQHTAARGGDHASVG